jgi:hypothetical protein
MSWIRFSLSRVLRWTRPTTRAVDITLQIVQDQVNYSRLGVNPIRSKDLPFCSKYAYTMMEGLMEFKQDSRRTLLCSTTSAVAGIGAGAEQGIRTH